MAYCIPAALSRRILSLSRCAFDYVNSVRYSKYMPLSSIKGIRTEKFLKTSAGGKQSLRSVCALFVPVWPEADIDGLCVRLVRRFVGGESGAHAS